MSTFDHAAYRAAEMRLHEMAVEYARSAGGGRVALNKLAVAAQEYAKAVNYDPNIVAIRAMLTNPVACQHCACYMHAECCYCDGGQVHK